MSSTHNQSFGSTVLRGIASVGGAAVFVAVLQVLSTAVLARYLGPAEWGGAAFALSALGFALAFGQFGLVQAVVHVAHMSRAHVSAASLSAWAWSGSCAVVFVLIAPFLERGTGIAGLHLYIYALAPCIVIRAVAGISEGAVLRQERFSYLSAVEIASYAAAYVGVGIPLAIWGGGGWALVCAYIAWTLFRSAGLVSFTGLERWARPARASFRDLLPFAGGQTLAQSANHVATESDNIIVGATFGPAALGVYSRAYSIAVAPANSLSAAIDKVFYSSLVRLRRADAPLGPTYLAATELAMGLALPAAVLTIVAAPEIIGALLGQKWSAAVLPLRVLSVGLVFRALFQMSDCFCRAVGAVYGSGIRQGAYAAMIISGSLIGSLWGPAGVAAGVVAAMAGKWLLMTQLSLSRLQLPAASYLSSVSQGARNGLLATLLMLATVQVCRNVQTSALMTCVASGLVFCAAMAFRLRSVTDRTLATS